MKRLAGRLAALIVPGLLAVSGAHASDIACSTMLQQPVVRCDDSIAGSRICQRRAGARSHASALICDYALLHEEYERIYADQQRMLRARLASESEILAWRKRRDACATVTCIDEVFAGWRKYSARKKVATAAPVQRGRQLAVATMHAAPVHGESQWSMPVARSRPEPAPTANAHVNAQANAPSDAPSEARANSPPEAPADAQANALADAPADAPANAPANAPSDAQANAPASALVNVEPAAVLMPEPAPQPKASPFEVVRRLRPGHAVGPWGWFGVLALPGMLGVGIAYLFRHRQGSRPASPRLRDKLHHIPAIRYILGGLALANGVLLVLILLTE